MQKIIYKNEDDTIVIIHPTQQGLDIFGINELAVKDTPSGLPFWIVDETVIPVDRTYRSAWRLDGTEGEPDGYGV